VTGVVPTTVMFLLSSRMGRLADRYGPRPFLTAGPIIVGCGFALMLRYGTSVSLFGDVLPALLVFSFGLAMTVSPLTATVLADAREADAGIASAVNNAIARTAGLISVAAVGAIVSASYAAQLHQRLDHRLPASSAPAVQAAKRRTFGVINPSAVPVGERAFAVQAAADASKNAFDAAVSIGAGLLFITGIGGLAIEGRRRRRVTAGDCPGGSLAGAPRAAADCDPFQTALPVGSALHAGSAVSAGASAATDTGAAPAD
jgi:hypothetical protein